MAGEQTANGRHRQRESSRDARAGQPAARVTVVDGQGRYTDQPVPPHEVYLHAGQWHNGGDKVVRTLLGSCIAVCVWDSSRQIGGMVHYLLPHAGTRSEQSPRFGNIAIATLLSGLQRLGSKTGDMRAKIVGGGCVLLTTQGQARHLGLQNADIAVSALRIAGVRVVWSEFGGTYGRSLVMREHDGMTWTRPIASQAGRTR